MKKHQFKIILGIIIMGFLFTRLLFLDSDLPPVWLTQYNPIDEFYYSLNAFNLWHHGTFVDNLFPYLRLDSSPFNIIGQLFGYFSLLIFNNNYYGLRFTSVLCTLLITIILYLVIKRYSPKNTNLVLCLTGLYLLTDFTFLISGRVVEPTIIRILGLMIIIFLATRKNSFKDLSYIETMGWGIIGSAVVIFIYPTNLFIYCALLATISYFYLKSLKTLIKLYFFFGIGTLITIFCYILFIYFSGFNIEEDILKIFVNHSISLNKYESLLISIKTLILNIIQIFETNIFRLNLSILFLFLISIPIVVYQTWKEKSGFLILICNLIIFILAQSLFINDYHYRKLIIFLPLVLIFIVLATNYAQNFSSNILKKKNKLLFSIYLFLSGLLVLSLYIFRISPNMVIELTFHYLNIFSLIVIISATSYFFILKKALSKKIIIILTIIMILPSLFLDLNFIYLHPKFERRDMMIELADEINGQIIAGSFAYSIRLYNSSIPILNYYKYHDNHQLYEEFLEKLIQEDNIKYSFGYTNYGDFPASMKEHGLILWQEFDNSLPDRKYSHKLGLFKKK